MKTIDIIRDLMSDGEERTLAEVIEATGLDREVTRKTLEKLLVNREISFRRHDTLTYSNNNRFVRVYQLNDADDRHKVDTVGVVALAMQSRTALERAWCA